MTEVNCEPNNRGPVQLVALVRTELEMEGDGTAKSPCRRITSYWSLEGELVARVDPLGPMVALEHLKEASEVAEGLSKRIAELEAIVASLENEIVKQAKALTQEREAAAIAIKNAQSLERSLRNLQGRQRKR